ncbi:hypothetical protein [Sphingomonas colocasiae]|uniref:NACHT domain-containing protein n=1 Tax=Sphingomonas colocasiae TaxID=1848973 RepID=A0ABS7PVF3_9SPHN|nr:hypothetical protein [Sphingomonas colocasiae]MBY8825121.1 hypothetical protein [Sphingomonas colocasiae]
MSWAKLESEVRAVVNLRYGRAAEAIRLDNGVNHDCVCKISERNWVIVEITRNDNVDKIRVDVNRLVMTRSQKFTQNHIMCECIIVLGFEPTPSMRDAAESNGIQILSASRFISIFFDQGRYNSVRNDVQFGSAVDIISGNPDTRPYIPVSYDDKTRSKSYDINEISRKLTSGQNVVLTGSFGSGKSRCYKEVFSVISNQENTYCISIDLREIGALASDHQIIRAHFEQIALDDLGEPAIRLLNTGRLIILLDGFDEMGGAQWSDDPQRLKEIRRRTLAPVRKLVEKSRATFISGRDHYFNNDEELLDALGIDADKSVHLECQEEFSQEQINQFLNSYEIDTALPDWLPKRPLLYQIVVELTAAGQPIMIDKANGHAELWDHIAKLICRREARINLNFEEDMIYDLLKRIGRQSRKYRDDVEPVTLEDLKSAYKNIRGYEPADEDAVLLQKLPGLGRISYDSNDRRFVDKYLVDGFRGSDLSTFLHIQDEDLSDDTWINSLEALGLSIVGKEISECSLLSPVLALAKRAADRGNSVLAADLISAIGFSDYEEIDGGGMVISGAEIRILDLSLCRYKNITFESCIIHHLQVPSYKAEFIRIKYCEIGKIIGVANRQGVPTWISESNIGEFDNIGNIASIKNLKLSTAQRILCVILHKTFFQPGRGRQEEALLRGLGQVDQDNNTRDILRILIRNGFLSTERGRHGHLYVPDIRKKPIASKIINLQAQCGEAVWDEVSALT